MLPSLCSLSIIATRSMHQRHGFGILSFVTINSCLVLNGCSQAMGLHCISASVEVGNAVLTASSALLSALTTLAVLGKQNKAAQLAGATRLRHTKSGFKKLSVAAFDKLVASLPDEVGSDLTTHCPGKWALHHVHDLVVTRCIVLYTVV